MNLLDSIPQTLLLSKDSLRSIEEKKTKYGHKFLLDYDHFTFCICWNEDDTVKINFVYSPSEKFNDSFCKCSITGKFKKNDDELTGGIGGKIILNLNPSKDEY